MKFDRMLFVRRSGGMADAQASGACSRKAVWVQVPSPALKTLSDTAGEFFYVRSERLCLPAQRTDNPFIFILFSQEWRNGRRAGFRCL